MVSKVLRQGHRAVRTGFALVAAAALCVGSFAHAQTPVTSGSPIPLTHPTYGQIMKVQVAKNGSVVLLDWSASGLYQLSPGKTAFTTIASGTPLEASGTFWNSGMTMDAKDTIYLADRYGAAHFFRIPYNPADGTWDFTGSNAWGATIGNGSVSLNTYDVAFIDSAAKDGSGSLVVSTETSPQIYTVPVDNQGNWGSPTVLVKGLKARATHITADANGNVYFLEDEGSSSTSRVTGVFFIPAGKNGVVGAGDGTAEAQLGRIDPAGNNAQYSGITLDASGNIYLSSQADSTGGAFNGDLMVPNVTGSPLVTSVSAFDFTKATFITPVSSSAPLAIDPRGFLWIPTSTSGWTPPGSTAYPGTNNVVLWAPSSADLGASPVGTASAVSTVYFSFSSAVTPGSFIFQQPGGGTDFVASATNPLADPAAITVQKVCTPGLLYPAYTSCPYWLTANPRTAGALSGELSMLDAATNVILQSTTYLRAVGQGPEISLLVPTGQTAIGTGYSAPQQVATDSLGALYVADSGKGQVLRFAAGSTSSTVGTPIGTGLTAPTGVAVDGSGNVFIGDAGKVIEIPFLNGALAPAQQATVQTGLGTRIRLAVNGAGTVFVTDPDNARVVKIANPLTRSFLASTVTIGSGFTKPSAIAVDNAGNVFAADGNTLSELVAPYYGVPTAITNGLVGPVTGLSVDASGSVYVAQSGGIIRIPYVAGTFGANSAAAIAGGVVTKPNSLAIDALGNLYLADLSAATPTVQQLTLNASVNLGIVSPFVPSTPVDVSVVNIGNLPLNVTASPTFSGPMGIEFSTTAATQNNCDTTGATPVAPGSSCIIDVQITAAGATPPTRTGTMSVTSNALNAPTVTAALTATASNLLETPTVTLTVTPASGITFPGAATVTATVAPSKSTNMPTGQVILTLINQNAKLNQSTTLPAGNLVNGTVTFNLTGILGGSYLVKAVYHGDANFGGNLKTTTITVTQAAPTVTLSTPSNITPILGTYYVPISTNTSLTAAISSPKGTPTGSVMFMNGTALADPKQPSTTLDANGKAVFSTINLPAGTYNLTAVYGGDQNFSTVSSPVVTFQVIPPSILLTAAPPTMSTTAGTPVQTVLTLQSLVGYERKVVGGSGGVQMACDNTTVPRYSECTFDVPHVSLEANKTATTTLTLSSNLPVNVASVRQERSSIVYACLLGMATLGLAFRRRTSRLRANLLSICLLLLAGGAALGLSGCTNGGYTQTPPAPHVITPSGTYNVRVYGTDPQDGSVKTLPFTVQVVVK